MARRLAGIRVRRRYWRRRGVRCVEVSLAGVDILVGDEAGELAMELNLAFGFQGLYWGMREDLRELGVGPPDSVAAGGRRG